jgi:hypothetical protein
MPIVEAVVLLSMKAEPWKNCARLVGLGEAQSIGSPNYRRALTAFDSLR